MPVADRRDYCQPHALLLQATTGGGTSNAPAISLRRMFGNGASFLRRTPREHVQDGRSELRRELLIGVNPTNGGALTLPGAGIRIREAFFLGFM